MALNKDFNGQKFGLEFLHMLENAQFAFGRFQMVLNEDGNGQNLV